jgi:lysophospholipase L1-like esterase
VASGEQSARLEQGLTPNEAYYQTVDWADGYAAEHAQIVVEFAPYVGWRHRQFVGEHINIGADGVRITPNTACDADDAFTVFMFGGSTMWGYSVPDAYTVPVYVHEALQARMDRPVCVINFGTWAYVSTQSMMRLTTELQRGNVPDLAIFYDGHNDIFAAFQNGEAGPHQNVGSMAARLSPDEPPPLVQMMQQTYTFNLIRLFAQGAAQSAPQPTGGEADENPLAAAIIDVYALNRRMVQSLAEQYGFEVWFFWQPDILVTSKALTEEEAYLRNNVDAPFARLVAQTYALMETTFEPDQHFVSLIPVFDQTDGTTWVDHVHLSPEGNAIIAQAMVDTIDSQRTE